MKTQAIIPTGGAGSRFGSEVPKSLVPLCGKPVCVHAWEIFGQSPVIDSVVVVVPEERIAECERIIEQFGLKKIAAVIAGGPTRRESVSNGLAVLDHDTKIVVVHDGVRPLVSSSLIEAAVTACAKEGAVITAVPVKPTIKKVDPKSFYVEETLDRKALWEIQTPQVFRKHILADAHQKNEEDDPTDDSVMVERLGVRVKIIQGDYRNIKITTQEDLLAAESFLKGPSTTNKAVHS